jgi:hypothetical protein
MSSHDPNRTGTIYDVAIDMAGQPRGVFMYILQGRQKQRAAFKTSQ